MKKIFSLMLAMVMPVLAACGAGTPDAQSSTTAAGTTAGEAPLLRVGYAQVNITPKDPVPMNEGGDEKGMSAGILDYLYANCVYLVDETGTELYLVAFDLCNQYNPLPKYRLELAKKLGVEEQQLMFSASHTHSSVNIKATKEASILQYNADLKKNLEKVALEAKEDAKAVTGMYHSAIETENLNFVRRYVMNDGTYAGDNYGSTKSGYADHETEGDHQLQLLKFTREGGKDVVLTNFQGHPHRTAYYDSKNNMGLSADVVGIYRQELEQRLDCLALYYTGSSGNMNTYSKINEENIHKTYKDHGKAMADYAVEAAANFVQLEFGRIRVNKTLYVGTCDHSEDSKLEAAKIVADRFNSGKGNSASLEGYEDLFEHARHAVSVVSKAGNPETMDVPLYTFSIGDFGICFAPFELFAELGISIKENSPFAATFVVCYSNNIYSYMPTQLAFSHGGYGPYKCNFTPGTGEELVEEFCTALKDLHNAQ